MNTMFGEILETMLFDAIAKDNPQIGELIHGQNVKNFLKEVTTAAGENTRSYCVGITDKDCNYLSQCGQICNKCGKVHSGHTLLSKLPTPTEPPFHHQV